MSEGSVRTHLNFEEGKIWSARDMLPRVSPVSDTVVARLLPFL